MKSLFPIITITLASTLCVAYSNETDHKAMRSAADYLPGFQAWQKSSDVSVESLAGLRALYIENALENLKGDYDGTPLEAIVVEINQNNSISIWVETTLSRKSIVSRFRQYSNGYESKSDAEILKNITPWYFDAFKYSCLELTCTGDFEELARADMLFWERGLEGAEGSDLRAVSRDATIDAILLLEKSQVLSSFDRSPTFEVRVFSDENDTISPGEYFWATNKVLVKARETSSGK